MRRELGVCLLLLSVTLAAYWQIGEHQFTNYDDTLYVTDNPHVKRGLAGSSVIWAFTATEEANWHPLTWLSHMLDCQLFGLRPRGHHLTSLFLHLANALLLFAMLHRMTGALWRSAFVSALFALHPLHVESVAWVAERKDVLSTLFWLLTMLAYARYVERPTRSRYVLTVAAFVLGLMAKPMLVTLPFVLLLLDYWPLERMAYGGWGADPPKRTRKRTRPSKERLPLSRLVWEKTPFFALAATSSIVTFSFQQRAGAMADMEIFPLSSRIANGLVSYLRYIDKMIWPSDLTVLYPHPGRSLPLWWGAGAGLALLGLSILVVRAIRRRPYLAVGWLWYMGTLVPVMGLVQVGVQAYADRYTYVPLIGLFIMIAWGIPDLAGRWVHARPGLAVSAAAALAALTACTWIQLGYWQNSLSLFTHALQVTTKNYVAHNNLGNALADRGKVEEAIAHYAEALRIKPDHAEAYNNWGTVLVEQGRLDEAVDRFLMALRVKPDYAAAHCNLGLALERKGERGEAIAQYLEALRLDPTYAKARFLHPLRRMGPKGKGRFERISWDVALDTIGERFTAIAASAEGPQAILPYSYAGTMGLVQSSSMDRRFFHRLGASLLDRTICATAGKEGYAATIGASIGTDLEQFENAKLVLIWGSNPVVSNLHLWSRVQEAKRRGAKLVAIDPYRSLSAEKCHRHLALLPGTDAALALGMMHVLIAENFLDRDYIDRYTLGFDALRERVRDYPPARVAEITGLAVEDLVALARDYGTIKPAAIRVNYGLQRHAGGAMAVRTIACLPALVGAWRDPAGGVLLSSSGTYPVDRNALERPDLIRGHPRTINMTQIGDALAAADPPVRAIHVYNSNPVAVAPESAKVVAGFAREDLFCVVHDVFLTDTADYADIVLPATTQLEHLDVHSSYGHLYALANNPAIAPVGEAKPNTEVFRLLARRMGFTEPCFAETDEEIARHAFLVEHPRARSLEWETLKKQGWQRLAVPTPFAPFAQGGFPTPSGKCEFYSETLKRQGLDPLPCYIPPRESSGSNPDLARRYPLAMISPPARHALNSTFANLPLFLEHERTPWLEIHPDDALARGIATGDGVRVYNGRGELALTARVTTRARPGVVVALSVWWRKLSPDGGNANALTGQALTDLGRAATFYDCLVEVERARGAK